MRPLLAIVLIACSPSWEEAAPILETRCASCHSAQGGAPFDFTEPGVLAQVADMAEVHVRAQTMPPWPPSDSGEPLRGDRRLPAEERQLLAQWFAGPIADHRVAPAPAPDVLEADSVVGVPPFEAPAGEGHRCFVVELPGRSMVGYAVERSGPVHHVLLGRYLDEITLIALDAADPAPGWDCPDAFMPGAEPSPEQVPVLWFPGSNPTRTYPGTGQSLEGVGVVQVHTSGEGQAAASVLFERRSGVLRERTLALGAGRIDPEQTPVVSRTAFVEDWMRGEDREDADTAIWLTGARGHGHDRLDRLVLRSGDHVLLELTRWEVAWQERYTFDQPVPMELTAPLTLECTYGASTGAYPSEHEMCGGWLFYTTEAPG